MKTAKGLRLHRAYMVFAGICLYYFVAYGLLYSGFGLFLSPMSEELGIPYIQLSFTTTVRVLAGMVTTSFIGTVFSRVKLRRFLGAALLGLAATLFLLSVSNALWQFLSIFFVMGLLCGLTLYGIVPILLNQWFEAPATLITTASACGGAGGIVLCPILSQIILHWDWRAGYQFMALMVLLVMLPITLVLFDFSPRDRGLSPLDNGKTIRDAAPAARPEEKGNQQGVLILITLFFLISALAGGMYSHISSLLLSKGFASLSVSLLIGCYQAGTTALQFLSGPLSTRIGLGRTLTATLTLTALGAGAMVFFSASSPLLLVIPAVFLVGGGRMFTALNPLFARSVFGPERFNGTYPRLQSIYLIGTAVTSVIYGGIYSETGSYAGTLWLMVGCMAALLIISHIILFPARARR